MHLINRVDIALCKWIESFKKRIEKCFLANYMLKIYSTLQSVQSVMLNVLSFSMAVCHLKI